MKHELVLAQLASIHSTVEALMALVSDDLEKQRRCCDQPRPAEFETYGGVRTVTCQNCGASEEHQQTTTEAHNGSRQA